MDKIKALLFTLILLIAVYLRGYEINKTPPALNWDEVSLGYNAYSVLKTGRDEWGQFLPLSFRAFGDYKLPLYVYLDAPFIGLFGLNEIALRLPSILSGIGIVVIIFFILRELTKSIYLSLGGMFIAATLPWLVLFSRIALEANVALFLTTVSFYLFLLSFRKKSALIYSAFLLGFSAFTYNSSRILIAPFLMLAIILFSSSFKKKEAFIPLIIILIFIGTAFFQGITIDSGQRYRWTTILDEGAIVRINELRGASNLSPLFSKLVFNKVTYFISEASKNYISHFNPDFLFKAGGSNFQFSVPGAGLIYLILAPLIIFGIFKMLKERNRWQLLVIGWLLLAPVPGAITRDAPHSLRTIFMTIPLLFSAVWGLKITADLIRPGFRVLLMSVILFFILINTYGFWQNLNGDYRKNYSWAWQYGYKEAIAVVKEKGQYYDHIVFTKKYGEPHAFLLFYTQYDPVKYQTDKNLIRYKRSDWFWVDGFDKFKFINDWEVKDKLAEAQSTLLITSPGNYPSSFQLLGAIDFLDGKRAFDIAAKSN